VLSSLETLAGKGHPTQFLTWFCELIQWSSKTIMLTTINENGTFVRCMRPSCWGFDGPVLMWSAAERSHSSAGRVGSGAPELSAAQAGTQAEAEVLASPRIAFTVTINMARSIRVTAKKRRGRPATTGAGTQTASAGTTLSLWQLMHGSQRPVKL
jgi:hypothetical protein